MSVTFNRQQLIRVAKTALAEHENAVKEYRKAVEDFKVKHAEQHTERTRDRATRLRDALTKALKKPGPIHAEVIRRSVGDLYRLDDSFYRPPVDYDIKKQVTEPTGLLKPAEVIETRSLIEVLEAATGDTVSANELKLLGLKNLQPIFAAASAELSEGRRLKAVK
jgi:hypothetical protein